jgi:predicted O-methyltransferase YrrM
MLNIRLSTNYLLHQFTAITRHGLHSPFVYRLVDEVIYDFSDKKVYQTIAEARKRLLNDNRKITLIADTEKTQYANIRSIKVNSIAKNSVLSQRVAQLLYRLAADHQPQNIIELGTNLGITTLCFQQAAPNARIFSLDNNPETIAITTEIFAQHQAQNIEQITGDIKDALPQLLNRLSRFDLLYINGNDTPVNVLQYFELCLPKAHEGTLFIVEGIYSNAVMEEAWAAIKAQQQVSITVDLFWIGLVYFRKGKVKEDFKIRFK